MEHHARIAEASARFVEALSGAEPSARVPSCPDWDAAELGYHLLTVQHFWTTILRDRLTGDDAPAVAEAAQPARPESLPATLELLRGQTGELLAALAQVQDDTHVWSWWGPEQTAGFTRRFQVHEATMHRIDAELAAGLTPTPIPADVAADGVAVALHYAYGWRPGTAQWAPTGEVGRLHAADTGQRWTVVLGTWSGTDPWAGRHAEGVTSVELGGGEQEPPFTVTAPLDALDAWLWNRPGYPAPGHDGDETAWQRFRAKVAEGIP